MVVNMMSGNKIDLTTGSYFLSCPATAYCSVPGQIGHPTRFVPAQESLDGCRFHHEL